MGNTIVLYTILFSAVIWILIRLLRGYYRRISTGDMSIDVIEGNTGQSAGEYDDNYDTDDDGPDETREIPHDTAIVLMGDSMFANEEYMDKKDPTELSVYKAVRRQHSNVFKTAEDNSTMENIKGQFITIPAKIKQSKKSRLFISVGGNDILNNYSQRNPDVDDMSILDALFEKYKKLIQYLQQNISGKIILTNIYYPVSKKYKKYHPVIKRWNRKQSSFADSIDANVFSIEGILVKSGDFTEDIEPSATGSRKIANEIIRITQDI